MIACARTKVYHLALMSSLEIWRCVYVSDVTRCQTARGQRRSTVQNLPLPCLRLPSLSLREQGKNFPTILRIPFKGAEKCSSYFSPLLRREYENISRWYSNYAVQERTDICIFYRNEPYSIVKVFSLVESRSMCTCY